MEIAFLLLKQIILMFILMSIGFLFYKKKMISDQGSSDLSRLLLYLVVPTVVINNLWTERTAQKTAELLQSSLLSVVCMAAAVIISVLFFRKKSGIAEFSASFSNVAFIGIPLITASVGSGAVFYISAFIVLVNALQWTAGVYMITGDRNVIKPGQVARNPIVLSVLAGLVLYVLNLPKPEFIQNLFSVITGMNTPLAMIITGIFLANADLAGMFGKKDTYLVSAARLIVIPLVSLFLLKVLPAGNTLMKTAILIGAACPVGSNVAVFARLYGKNDTEAVEHVCVTTLLSLFTLPLVIMLAGALLN